MTHVMIQANEALLVNQQANQNQNGEADEFRGLGKFQKNNPIIFKGRYDPNGAHAWIQEIEKIVRDFLDKYFQVDVPNPKEIKFLELKQRNMYTVDYAAKFEKLSRYCPQYNGVDTECSKCVKFVNGTGSEIK
ncbi:uncharacterized protein LOC127101183 [Lathyrus oleraceus]|uniref:uncharacterized protein LOC127101183 n=1 Tax=Pisum sativum TaxID=3888 RepID=UPI0021CEBE08|nr:uncharacterized protein LOC127101183 [Pisum sativum]